MIHLKRVDLIDINDFQGILKSVGKTQLKFVDVLPRLKIVQTVHR